jgi:hypothetical protein
MFALLAIRRESGPTATTTESRMSRATGKHQTTEDWGVGRGLHGPVQAKLSIGAVNDPLEAEADRIAEQVHRQPERDAGDDRGQQERKPSPNDASVPSANDLRVGSGRPLETSLRDVYEPRFGFDFSRVRIYSNQEAARSAESLGARAYTMGPDIVFSGGAYRPGTAEGQKLLAHELTHIVQQGHAPAISARRGQLAVRQTTPAIQRDPQPNAPPTKTGEGEIKIGITKRYNPDFASRDEVVRALTDRLTKEMALQGTGKLAISRSVEVAVRKLFQGNPGNPTGDGWFVARMSKNDMPTDSPADFAAKVGAQLPDFIPRKQMMHLDNDPVPGSADTSATGRVKEAVKEKIGEMGKPPKDEGNPPVEAPGTKPTMGSPSPGQHTISTPTQTFGDKSPRKPSPPVAPATGAQDDVRKIVQALDKTALIPAAAKGTPKATDFITDAEEYAETIAQQLTEAERKKRSTVYLIIGDNYYKPKIPDDLKEIFDKLESMVRQIANALPAGVKDVDEVIITPSRATNIQQKVKLH